MGGPSFPLPLTFRLSSATSWTARLLLATLMFAPVLLSRAEPARLLVVLADRAQDSEVVSEAFVVRARADARAEIETFLRRKWAKELDYRPFKELWAYGPLQKPLGFSGDL